MTNSEINPTNTPPKIHRELEATSTTLWEVLAAVLSSTQPIVACAMAPLTISNKLVCGPLGTAAVSLNAEKENVMLTL